MRAALSVAAFLLLVPAPALGACPAHSTFMSGSDSPVTEAWNWTTQTGSINSKKEAEAWIAKEGGNGMALCSRAMLKDEKPFCQFGWRFSQRSQLVIGRQ